MSDSGCSPSQTVGPFFHCGLTNTGAVACLVDAKTKGERIRVRFRMFDGDGLPVPDGIVELWQADADGKYTNTAFCGFGRLGTDASGTCLFETVQPGYVSDEKGHQAAHISVSIFARGLLARLCTRMYFAGDPVLAEDPVLALVPQERRRTLLATPDPSEPNTWNFDIRLQGEQETVFFEV